MRCRKPGNLPPKGDGYAPHNAAQAGLFLCRGLICYALQPTCQISPRQNGPLLAARHTATGLRSFSVGTIVQSRAKQLAHRGERTMINDKLAGQPHGSAGAMRRSVAGTDRIFPEIRAIAA